MKTRTNLVALGTAAVLAAGVGTYAYTASAEGGFGPPFMRGMMGGGMAPGMMGGSHGPFGAAVDPSSHLDTLKTDLGITAAQEPAWTKYTKAVEDAAATMKTAQEGVNPDAVGSPQDRFAFMTNMREQGQKQFETLQTAANELLAALDDAQKAKAQTSLPGLVFGPGAMHTAGGPPFRH